MVESIDNRLDNIEKFLSRIESKLDNFLGFEELSKEELEEIIKIKKEMDEGDSFSIKEVFN